MSHPRSVLFLIEKKKKDFDTLSGGVFYPPQSLANMLEFLPSSSRCRDEGLWGCETWPQSKVALGDLYGVLEKTPLGPQPHDLGL